MSFSATDAIQAAVYLTAVLALLISFTLVGVAADRDSRLLIALAVIVAPVGIAGISVGQGIECGRSKENVCQN